MSQEGRVIQHKRLCDLVRIRLQQKVSLSGLCFRSITIKLEWTQFTNTLHHGCYNLARHVYAAHGSKSTVGLLTVILFNSFQITKYFISAKLGKNKIISGLAIVATGSEDLWGKGNRAYSTASSF